MWKVMMVYPESTQGAQLYLNEPTFAEGMVHHAELEVARVHSLQEARLKVLELAIGTLKEQGYKSPIAGYGVRSTLAKRKTGPLYWQLLLPQLVDRIKKWKAYKRSLEDK